MQATMEALTWLLNYCATHPNASIRYHASNMVMWAHSNASYLSAPKGQSCTASYYFLSSWPNASPIATDPAPPDNGPIHVLCQIMHKVVASAAEGKLGACFLNTQTACPMHMALDGLGHLQPPTPLQTDISTACGIINDMVKQKRSKAIDMQLTGSMTTHARDHSIFFGALTIPIAPIIFPNVINLCTTLTFIHSMPNAITTLPYC